MDRTKDPQVIEAETTALVRHESQTAIDRPRSVEDLTARVKLVQEVMRRVMKDGEHYGHIPGTDEKKKVLKKAGAEILSLTFRLTPEYRVTMRPITDPSVPPGHREYEVICRLSDGTEGVGACSTLESKYRYRNAARKCPLCGIEAIIKGKTEYGGGWVCFKKKSGCGAKFKDGDASIEGQSVGRAENPDPADTYNTVLKMAKKRAHVDSVQTATGTSDIFTQDIGDSEDDGEGDGGTVITTLPPEGLWVGSIEEVDRQNKTTRGDEKNAPRPYTIHTLHAETGHIFKTFSSSMAECAEKNEQVAIKYSTNKYGELQIDSIQPATSEPESEPGDEDISF